MSPVGCDGVYYKKEEQLCCDGKLTERDPNIECCYGQLMDVRASYCEWAMVMNKDENGKDIHMKTRTHVNHICPISCSLS